MKAGVRRQCAQLARWWIHRNPTYLISAVAMALGARWYLVEPDAPAGEIGLILLTLGVLQLYEAAVAAAVITLHRFRKSPEDQPSLLLVAALFWTGPMAATIEMTAQFGDVGIGFAAAACLIALLEMQSVRRTLRLHVSPWGQAYAAGCVILLAAAPAVLRRTYEGDGRVEWFLYATWWVLAGLSLLVMGAMAWHRRRIGHDALIVTRQPLNMEMTFCTLVLVACGVHVWGMNYAFFTNARAFYATPLLAIVTVLLFEWLAGACWRPTWIWLLVGAVPLAGVVLSGTSFDPNVPLDQCPAAIRNPLIVALILAAAAWWFGALRGGPFALVHVGAAAGLLVVLQLADAVAREAAGWDAILALAPVSRDEVVLVSYAAIAYLLALAALRRSRTELVIALCANIVAFAIVIADRVAADAMYVTALAGWTWIVIVHLLVKRPQWYALALPFLTLLGATIMGATAEHSRMHAAGHGGVMIAVFVTLAFLCPSAGYRIYAAICVALAVPVAIERGATRTGNPRASMAVLAAFVLLGGGITISWFKGRLLKMACGQSLQPGGDASDAPGD